MFGTQEVLKVARQAEIATADKTSRERRYAQATVAEIEE